MQDTESKAQSVQDCASQAAAEWRKPELVKLQALSAEGADFVTPDGSFTS